MTLVYTVTFGYFHGHEAPVYIFRMQMGEDEQAMYILQYNRTYILDSFFLGDFFVFQEAGSVTQTKLDLHCQLPQ